MPQRQGTGETISNQLSPLKLKKKKNYIKTIEVGQFLALNKLPRKTLPRKNAVNTDMYGKLHNRTTDNK